MNRKGKCVFPFTPQNNCSVQADPFSPFSHGFAIQLQPDTQLGLAMLIAEDEGGHYEPVAVTSTINEAKELATSDLKGRMREVDRGGDPGLCPYEYKVWAQGADVDYLLAATFPATSL